MVRWCLNLLLGWMLLASTATARDIFVDNLTGDDRSTGERSDGVLAYLGPVQTISKALRLALPGDHIILAANPEPYHESISLSGSRQSGLGDLPLVIEGNGAILDGSLPIPPTAWHHTYGEIFRFRPSRLGFQQLFLNGRPAVRQPATSLDYKLPDLQPREWAFVGGFIYFCVEPGKMPDDYNPSCAFLSTGVTLYQVRNVAIGDLVVQGFQLDGINAADGAIGILLSGVTCRGNGRSGISVGGSSRVTSEDSTLGDNGAAQLRTEGWSHTVVSGCQLLPNTAPAYERVSGELTLDGAIIGEGLPEAE
jgi:hypothetical protein